MPLLWWQHRLRRLTGELRRGPLARGQRGNRVHWSERSHLPSLASSLFRRKYDVLTAKHIEALRKHTKAIQDARLNRDNEGIKAALKLYDDALEK
jgi:hypothetical protein